MQSSNNDRAIKLFLGSILQKAGENGCIFRAVMKELELTDWEQRLKDGEKILINRQDALTVTNALIEDDEHRNMMVDLNLIRGESRWLMTKGEPIRYNIEVIAPSYRKLSGENEAQTYIRTKMALEHRLTEAMGDYSLYPLDGKNFLVKRNDISRDSYSASMLSRLAKRCGINARTAKEGLVLGGTKQMKLARIARARTLTNKLMGEGTGRGTIREVAIVTPDFVVVVSGGNKVVILGKNAVVYDVFDGEFNIRCDRKLSSCSPRHSRAARELIEIKYAKSFAHSKYLRANENGYLFNEQEDYGVFELSESNDEDENGLGKFFCVSTVRELCCVILAQIPELKDVELLIERFGLVGNKL